MIKGYLIVPLCFLSIAAFGQNSSTQIHDIKEALRLPDSNSFTINSSKKINKHLKAFGDTLYYQGFSNGVPAGYAVSNANQNNATWKWDTTFANWTGQFTRTIPSINSTTVSNGFMLLPSDFYNTPLPLAIIMDTWFVSDTINIPSKPSVFIKFEHFFRFCCLNTSEMVLELSLDKTNWVSFNVKHGVPINASNVDTSIAVDVVEFDVSSVLANQTQFWYRFRSTGNSHYFWMIDDVLFIEGPKQDLELSEAKMLFNEDHFDLNLIYHQIPYGFFIDVPFSGRIKQNGWEDNTNVSLDVNVFHKQFGLRYSASENIGTLGQNEDTLVQTNGTRFHPGYTYNSFGDHQMIISVSGDSTDEKIGNDLTSKKFSITDSIYARDDNEFNNGIGPANYFGGSPQASGGTSVGDRFGSLYVIEMNSSNFFTTNFPKSVSFVVSNSVKNIGVQIVSKMWSFNINHPNPALAMGNVVASSYFARTITAADTSTIISVRLDTGYAVTYGLDSGIYLVGWEVVNLPQGTTFEVMNDLSTAVQQPDASNFVWLGHAPGWGWTNDNPGIRLNFRLQFIVGFGKNAVENRFEFSVLPNPNSGLFKLNLFSEVATPFTLNIRNTLGQIVHDELINVNGSMSIDIDLSSFQKGLYFVSLENENKRMVKKVILK